MSLNAEHISLELKWFSVLEFYMVLVMNMKFLAASTHVISYLQYDMI